MKSPRLLCINPWIYDFAAYDYFSKPLGLLYLASFLRQRGLTVDYIDCLDKWHPELLKLQGLTKPKIRHYGIGSFHRQPIPTPDCLKFVPRRYACYGLPEDIFIAELKARPRPDAILLTSFMTYWYFGPKRVAELCREFWPGVPIILGGIYATLMPDHARQTIQPDYLITGPGEYKATELLAELLKMPELLADFPARLDDFPYPAFDLIRHNDYLIVMSSRGCPFRCTFCATYHIDSDFTQRQPDRVVQEIVEQANRFGVTDIAFYDDALLMQADRRIKPILHDLIARKADLRFHTPNGVHGRYIDEELADLMYRSGFKTIRISLESVAKERRRDLNNKITPGEMTRATQNLVKAGFKSSQVETYIIMGLPNQTIDEVIDTILYAYDLGVQIRLSVFSPIPGTVDYQRAVEQGHFPADADPLLTNKTIVPLFRTEQAFRRFHAINAFTRELNADVVNEQRRYTPESFRQTLQENLIAFA